MSDGVRQELATQILWVDPNSHFVGTLPDIADSDSEPLSVDQAKDFASGLGRALLCELVAMQLLVIELEYSQFSELFIEIRHVAHEWHLEGEGGAQLSSSGNKWHKDTWPEFRFEEFPAHREAMAVNHFLEELTAVADECEGLSGGELVEAAITLPGFDEHFGEDWEDDFGEDWDLAPEDEVREWVRLKAAEISTALDSGDSILLAQIASDAGYGMEWRGYRLSVPTTNVGSDWGTSEPADQVGVVSLLENLRNPETYGACDLLLTLIAMHPGTAEVVLDMLASDSEPRVRGGVAINASSSFKVLMSLAMDRHLEVRMAATRNPKATEDIRAAAAVSG